MQTNGGTAGCPVTELPATWWADTLPELDSFGDDLPHPRAELGVFLPDKTISPKSINN
jgi:hypothetical protein